jgi:DNA-binding transcriptional LysR family regulator
MLALERSLAGQDARLAGPARVTCTDPYLAKLLLKGLSVLCEQHPGIELELDADAKYLDLSKREADVAVRALGLDVSPPEHLIGRRLVPITVCTYVANAHAERLDPERFSGVRLISSHQRKVMEALVATSSYPGLSLWGSFDSMPVMIESAVAGLGLVVLPTYVGDQEPRLQRLAKPDVRHMADFWLLSHGDLRDNARVRAVREHIATALLERAPLFRGEP